MQRVLVWASRGEILDESKCSLNDDHILALNVARFCEERHMNGGYNCYYVIIRRCCNKNQMGNNTEGF